MPKLIMSNSQYCRTRLVTYNKKWCKYIEKKYKRFFFGRYDKTRAKVYTD